MGKNLYQSKANITLMLDVLLHKIHGYYTR